MNQQHLSRVDVSVKLVSDFFDHITDAQEQACGGNLDEARALLKAALRDCAEMEALTQNVLDDLSRFSLLAATL